MMTAEQCVAGKEAGGGVGSSELSSQLSLMNGVRAADAQAEIEHSLAHAVNLLCSRNKAIPYNVQRRFVRYQQRTRQKIGFRLNTSIACALPAFGERGCALMTKKAMRQFVANIAPLAEGMMGIIVNNNGVQSAWHSHCRE